MLEIKGVLKSSFSVFLLYRKKTYKDFSELRPLVLCHPVQLATGHMWPLKLKNFLIKSHIYSFQ